MSFVATIADHESLLGSFLAEVRSWRRFGRANRVDAVQACPRYVNEFWSAKQRGAHRLHEVSYRACFKGELPRFFIDRLSRQGDRVYDPFMGRGTTLIEAALKGRACVGNDVNPLCAALTEPRLCPPTLEAIVERLGSIQFNDDTPLEHHELQVFFHPRTLGEVETLRRYFLERSAHGTLDEVDAWLRMVALSRLTGHFRNVFSVYTLPPNQAVSIEAQRKINARRNQVPPYRDTKSIILKKSTELLRDGRPPRVPYELYNDSSERTPDIADDSIDLTITSPPFLDVVDYSQDNWLRCWFIGLDSARLELTRLRRLEDWTDFIEAVLVEIGRVTKPGGCTCLRGWRGEVRPSRA